MEANIDSVDYEAMPGQIQELRSLGQSINEEVTRAFQSISEMHSSWYGEQYNKLVQKFNDLIPELNSLLHLVVGEIPYTLETIANNYARYEELPDLVTAKNTEPKQIQPLPIIKDVGMRILTERVEPVKIQVSGNFAKVIEYTEAIGSKFAQINWKSDSSKVFEENLSKLKASIITSFEDLKAQFTNLMNETIEASKNLEKANTLQ